VSLVDFVKGIALFAVVVALAVYILSEIGAQLQTTNPNATQIITTTIGQFSTWMPIILIALFAGLVLSFFAGWLGGGKRR